MKDKSRWPVIKLSISPGMKKQVSAFAEETGSTFSGAVRFLLASALSINWVHRGDTKKGEKKGLKKG